MEGFNANSINAASAEAATAPTQFNATERSAMIHSTIVQIQDMLQRGKTVDFIKQVLPDFCESYPSIFAMVTRPGGFDYQSMSLMIKMLEKMGNRSLSQHEASIRVGKHLLDKFVTPQINGS